MKIFTDAAKAALQSGETIVSAAVEVRQANGVAFNVWGGDGLLTISDAEFTGLGSNALANASAGALGDSAQNVEISLSGVDPTVMGQLSLPLLRSAGAVIRRLIFDGSGTQLLDQHVFSRGAIDTADSDETPNGPAKITGQVEGAAKGLGRAGGRMRTDADQRLIDPADAGFAAVSNAGQKTLYWGGEIPTSASAATRATPLSGVGSGINVTGIVSGLAVG